MGKKIILFLDYDGTLTPIVDHPREAKLPPSVKKALQHLDRIKAVKICVISGRGLAELKEFVGLPGLVYAGNHGLEFEGPNIRHVHPGALEIRKFLEKISAQLEKALHSIPGILVENKIFTISVHYRRTPPAKIDQAHQLFLKTVQPHVEKSQVILTEGKKVWEIRPAVQWNKGAMVLWLLGRELTKSAGRVLPIYLGDDQTDEDAFEVVKDRGLGVKITDDPSAPTEAFYFLPSPSAVLEFLGHLTTLKSGKLLTREN